METAAPLKEGFNRGRAEREKAGEIFFAKPFSWCFSHAKNRDLLFGKKTHYTVYKSALYIYVHMCTYIYIYKNIYIFSYIYSNVYAHILSTHTHTHTWTLYHISRHIHIYIYTPFHSIHGRSRQFRGHLGWEAWDSVKAMDSSRRSSRWWFFYQMVTFRFRWIFFPYGKKKPICLHMSWGVAKNLYCNKWVNI